MIVLIFTVFWFVAQVLLPMGLWARVHFTLFYFSMLGTYLVTYLNTLEEGPSFQILTFMEKTKRSSKEDLIRLVTNCAGLNARLRGMVKGGTVVLKDGTFEITEYGRKYLAFFTFYRRLLGLRHRGG